MTLEELTMFRRDELVRFFEVRFGKHWRQIVTNRTGLHPRTFQYWKYVRATSLYRQLLKLENWARSVGFESPLDEKVEARLLAYERLRRAAQEELHRHESKRNRPVTDELPPDSHEMARQIAEAMRRAGGSG